MKSDTDRMWLKRYLHDLKWAVIFWLIVLAVVFISVGQIKGPSDKIPEHAGGYYNESAVSF